MLDWHLVKQNCEDTLLHLTSILCTEDDHLLLGKVDGDTGGTSHTSGVSVGREGSSIVDDIVRVEVFQFLSLGSDKHVSHEQGVVGTSADDSDVDSVSLIPSSKSIDDVDSVPGVKVIDSTFSVDLPDLC